MKLRNLLLPILIALAACATAPKKPDWISGKAGSFPAEQYFLAVGKAPFSAKPGAAQASADQEAVKQLKAGIQNRIQTQLSAELSRELAGLAPAYAQRVSAEVNAAAGTAPEGIGIADRYCEEQKGFCYALAALDRRKAAEALRAKLNEQELAVSDRFRKERDSLVNRDPLTALGLLLQAESALAQELGTRAQYIVVSGESVPAKYTFAGLAAEQEAVRSSVNIMVFVYAEAPGKNSGEVIGQYLTGSLNALGFTAFSAPADLKKIGAAQVKALLLKGALNPRPPVTYVLLAGFSTKKIGETREGGVSHLIYRTGGEMQLFDVNTRESLITMFDTAPEATTAQDPKADRAASLSLNQAGEYFSKIWTQLLTEKYLKP